MKNLSIFEPHIEKHYAFKLRIKAAEVFKKEPYDSA